MKAIRSCAYPNVSRSGCTVERGCRVHRLIARRACRLGSRQASHLIDLERKRSCTGSVHSSGSSLHETRESGSSHAAELVSCWRAWPDASGTSPRDAPREPLRRDLSARPPRRVRDGGGSCGEVACAGFLLRGKQNGIQWSIRPLISVVSCPGGKPVKSEVLNFERTSTRSLPKTIRTGGGNPRIVNQKRKDMRRRSPASDLSGLEGAGNAVAL